MTSNDQILLSNPETNHQNIKFEKNLKSSNISLINKLINYQDFYQQKSQRKNISKQRQNVQLDVAYLYRQAKKASKELAKKQSQLIEQMSKKTTKYQEQQKKQQLKRLKQQQLSQLKNTNSLSRYMNMLKRDQIKKQFKERNQLIAQEIKQKQKNNQSLKKWKKREEQKLLNEKNKALAHAIDLGTKLSKAKSLYANHHKSTLVKQQILTIQNMKKQSQKQKIQQLKAKQQSLKQFYQKTSKLHEKYENKIKQTQNATFEQMYNHVTIEAKSIKKKKKNNSVLNF